MATSSRTVRLGLITMLAWAAVGCGDHATFGQSTPKAAGAAQSSDAQGTPSPSAAPPPGDRGATAGSGTAASGASVEAVSTKAALISAAAPETAPTPTAAAPSPAVPAPTVQPAPAAPSTPACIAAAQTQAVLLTTSITNNSANSYLEYQVSRTDCAGKPLPLTADIISFDLNSELPGFAPVQYTITGGTVVQNGTMDDIPGSDLFGNVGGNFAHWNTDQAVSITSGATSVTLRIALPDVDFMPLNGPSNALATYLRYGDAAPVTKTVVLVN